MISLGTNDFNLLPILTVHATAGSRLTTASPQLAPPLTFAKMAAIATIHGLQRNVPETVAHLTGGEYFKLTDAKSLERDLATISNHLPNRYVLSFHPQAPHPGLHAIELSMPDYEGLEVTARSRYLADAPISLGDASP